MRKESEPDMYHQRSKFEKKFGKYAIPNLTVILLLCYGVGYCIELFANDLLPYLTLNPCLILKGQIWRLVTWLLIPPSGFDIFTLIMLLFYYNIGTALERTWGTYKYNVYLFSGMFLTVAASFLCMGFLYLMANGEGTFLLYNGFPVTVEQLFQIGAFAFSTSYISLSIYLAFAATYPNMQVLLMFVVPVKMKWMGILDVILMVYSLFAGNIFTKFAVGAALINVGLFYLINIKGLQYSPKQIKRRTQFKQDIKRNSGVTKHKCAICGRTDEDGDNMEFRFCSKCNGNYEYCRNHLFTHEHVK
ncbi:MAG: hypothetical protein NC126_11590 [Clostridium sp.]|nr:hypothetical protein [Clostridium sp.]